jgi:hypothetical protein
VLVGIVVLSTVARGVAGAFVPTPWINPDEVIYAELGRSLWTSGQMTILGVPTRFYSLVYPALAGGPLALHDHALGYELLKWLQALVMSAAAVPVYLWGCRLAGPRWALVAAALTVAMPGLAYSGLVMSEVAFYPVAVAVAWAWARALETPTTGRQLLAVGVIVLAVLTRVQALALLPALPTAIVLLLVFRRSFGVRPYLPMLVGGALVAAGWSAWQLVGGGTPANVLGAYRAAGESSYHVGDAARFVLYHAADVLLLTGIVPVCAVALLLLEAFRGRVPRPEVQAHLAVTAAISAWFVLEVGVFASRHVGFLAERNLFAIGPLFFLGLVTWLRGGAARSRAQLAVVAASALALVAALPVGRLATRASFPDTFSLIPLYRLRHAFVHTDLRLLLVVLAVGALELFVLVGPRSLWIVPSALLLVFATTSVFASVTVASEARALESKLLGGDNRNWVDDHATAPVTYLHAGELWNAVYENRFWSRRIDSVYTLPGPAVPGPIPTSPVGPLPDGRVVFKPGYPASARFVVAPDTVTFFGKQVAHATRAGLALWSIDAPLRMSTWIFGMGFARTAGDRKGDLERAGDIAAQARLVVYGCSGGVLKLSLESQYRTVVRILENGLPVRGMRLAPGDGWSGEVGLTPFRGARAARFGDVRGTRGVPQCTIDILSSTLLHVPRFELVRA